MSSNPKFCIIHALIFDTPRSGEPYWSSIEKLSKHLRGKHGDIKDCFTVDKVRRIVKNLIKSGYVGVDKEPLTYHIGFYSFTVQDDPLMKEVFNYCKEAYPEVDFGRWTDQRIASDFRRWMS